jgi:hypothetical protein
LIRAKIYLKSHSNNSKSKIIKLEKKKKNSIV